MVSQSDPSEAPSTKKSTPKPAHDAPPRGRRQSHAGLLNLPPVGVVGGKAAALVDLARRAAEDLVVGREQNDLALGIDSELDARRGRLGIARELLDDASHRGELAGDRSPASPSGPRRQGRESVAESRAPGDFRIPEDRVAFAREAIVELQHGPARSRRRRAARRARPRSSSERRSSEPSGSRRPPPERPSGCRTSCPAVELRVHAVQRDPQKDGELRSSGVELKTVRNARDGSGDAVADALDQTRPLEDLLRQRARRGVMGAEKRQPGARVARRECRREAGSNTPGSADGLAGGHVDHPGLGIAQADQEEKQALLVEARRLELGELALIERQGGDHDRGVGLLSRAERALHRSRDGASAARTRRSRRPPRGLGRTEAWGSIGVAHDTVPSCRFAGIKGAIGAVEQVARAAPHRRRDADRNRDRASPSALRKGAARGGARGWTRPAAAPRRRRRRA